MESADATCSAEAGRNDAGGAHNNTSRVQHRHSRTDASHKRSSHGPPLVAGEQRRHSRMHAHAAKDEQGSRGLRQRARGKGVDQATEPALLLLRRRRARERTPSALVQPVTGKRGRLLLCKWPTSRAHYVLFFSFVSSLYAAHTSTRVRVCVYGLAMMPRRAHRHRTAFPLSRVAPPLVLLRSLKTTKCESGNVGECITLHILEEEHTRA